MAKVSQKEDNPKERGCDPEHPHRAMKQGTTIIWKNGPTGCGDMIPKQYLDGITGIRQ